MNELELIVQRMIDAGEPEENIASVIKEFESREAGKTTPTTPGVVVEETATPELTLTESKLVDTSLELPKIKTGTVEPTLITKEELDKQKQEEEEQKKLVENLSIGESLSNAFSQAYKEGKKVGEFWSGESPTLNIAASAIAQGIFGKENIDKVSNLYGGVSVSAAPGVNIELVKGLGSKTLLDNIAKLEKEKAETKPTLPVIESFKQGKILKGIAGLLGSVVNVGGSVAYGLGTAATGYFMDFTANNYVSFNEGLAKRKNKTLEQLILDDEANISAPVALAGLQTAAEALAFGKITGKLSKATKKASEKAIFNNKSLDVIATGRDEAITEMAQYGLEEYNRVLGESGNNIKAAGAFISAIGSQEGLESGIQGFAGGAGIKGSRYMLSAASKLRASEDTAAIENDISELSKLNKSLSETKDDVVKEGIQKSIDEVNKRLSSRIIKGNSILPNFSNKDISEISSMDELAQTQVKRVKELQSKLDSNAITTEEYNTALEGFKKSYLEAKNKINGVKAKAEDRGNKEAQKVNELYAEKGKASIAEILDLYKPMAKRIASKYKNVPGFEMELMVDEILTGERGILDLINSYKPETNVPLAAYINKYAATRGIEAAQRNLKQEFELDVTEAKGITDTTTTETEIELKEEARAEIKTELAKDLNLSEETQSEVLQAVEKTLGTKLPAVTDKKFKQDLVANFRNELSNTFKDIFGKTAAYEQFLRDNFEKIYPAIPQEVINRSFKEFNEPVLDPRTGKQAREKTAEGKKVFKKKDISKAEFIKYFVDAPGNVKGARKTSLANTLAGEVGLDNVLKALSKPEVVERFKGVQEIQGQEVPANFRSIISKAINRIDDLITALDKFEQDKNILRSDFGLSVPAIKVIKLFLKGVRAGLKAGLTIEKAISKALKNIDKYSKAEKLSSQEQTIIEKAIKSIPAEEYISKPAEDIINRIDKEYKNLFKEEQSKTIDEILIPLYKDKAKGKTKEQRVELAKEFWRLYWRTFQNIKGTKKEEMYSIINTIFGEDFKFTNKSIDGEKFKANLIDQSKTSEFAKKYKNNKEKTIADQHDQADYNFNKYIDLLNNLKEKYNNKEITIDNVYFLLKATGADMNSVGKKIQRLGENVDLEALNKNMTMTLEHNSPFDFTLKNILLPYILNDIKSSKELVNILKLQKLELINAKKAYELNDKDGFNLKTAMPAGYKITDDPIVRLLKVYPNLKKDLIKEKPVLTKDFNKFLEASTKVDWAQTFSPDKASIVGKGKGKYKFFVPYSAEDFVGLLYTTLAKGETGNKQMAFYKENLLNPYARAIRQFETDKQLSMNAWANLKKQINNTPAKLGKTNETGYTNEQVVRLYIWNKQNTLPEGSDKKDVNQAIKFINKNPKLKEFAEQLISLAPPGEYSKPSGNWLEGTITTDMLSYVNEVKRSEYMNEWKTNVEEIFGEFKQGQLEGPNINKLKALYGKEYIESLTDILYRMKDGRNRKRGGNKIERAWLEWVNGSVGSIMFLNARSALLQTISAVNFINFTDNNPIMAAKAFANQKQFWDDFGFLFNSDFLKQRRSGLKTDVNADEIANAASTADNKVRAAFNAILKFGFLPTQMADSFAIAIGGASFYRNRVNKYIKYGMTNEAAQEQAFLDFAETAEESQQSSRPDRISMQQASSLGRVILAFANTPMQYARLSKKALQDLVAGRGDWKTNVSKLMYYSVIQNIIFSALQQALFALLFSDEEDEKEKERLWNIGNSSIDTLLRGAGLYGAIAATSKNVILEIIEQSKSKRTDYTKAVLESTSISPPINSKLRKLNSAAKAFTYRQSKEKMRTEGFSLDNPAFLASGQVISALTNLPADRVISKADHIKTAMESETELWQSIALGLGYSEWDLNMIEKQTEKSSKFNKFSKFKKFKK